MRKTTVYLSAETLDELRVVAAREKRSVADLIRESIELNLRLRHYPRPTLPLFHGAASDLAERADDYLEGFGAQ